MHVGVGTPFPVPLTFSSHPWDPCRHSLSSYTNYPLSRTDRQLSVKHQFRFELNGKKQNTYSHLIQRKQVHANNLNSSVERELSWFVVRISRCRHW